MKVLFACGGSGGHITPAIAMAQMLSDTYRDFSCVFAGSENGMERKIVQKEGYPFRHIAIEGLHRSLTLKNLRTLYLAVTAPSSAAQIIKKECPDLVIGTGGYVCFPFIKAAKKLHLPALLYEPNAVPGLSVKLTEKAASALLLQFEECKKHLRYPQKAVVIGAPLRRNFSKSNRDIARKKLSIPKEAFLVLSFGGSLGAEGITQAAMQMDSKLPKGNILHIHACGERLFAEYKVKYPEQVQSGRLLPYINDMPEYMAAADLVICRAGAMTLAELSHVGRSAILIPSPYVAGDHQTKNAALYQKKGAAFVLNEKELRADLLLERILFCKENPLLLRQMEASAAKLSLKNAKNSLLNTIRKYQKG